MTARALWLPTPRALPRLGADTAAEAQSGREQPDGYGGVPVSLRHTHRGGHTGAERRDREMDRHGTGAAQTRQTHSGREYVGERQPNGKHGKQQTGCLTDRHSDTACLFIRLLVLAPFGIFPSLTHTHSLSPTLSHSLSPRRTSALCPTPPRPSASATWRLSMRTLRPGSSASSDNRSGTSGVYVGTPEVLVGTVEMFVYVCVCVFGLYCRSLFVSGACRVLMRSLEMPAQWSLHNGLCGVVSKRAVRLAL